MKRLFLYCVTALLLTTAGFAQKVVETDPLRPVETGAVTITYRPELDDKDGKFGMKDVTEVWVYTGARGAAIAQDPTAPYYEKYGWNDLKNYPELKLKNNGDGTFTLKIDNIKAFYNVPDDKPVRELLFVFRNVDGTVQGSDRLVAVDPVGGSATAGLRLINGVFNSTGVDVIAAQADEAQISNIGFQLASVFKDVPSGDAVQIKAKATGAPAPIYADLTQKLAKDGKYTVLVGADASGDEYVAKVVADDVETTPGVTKVRFVHWSPSTPAVDIRAVLPTGALSDPIVGNAKFGDVAAYLPVPAGTYKLAVTAAGQTTALITFNPIDLPAATNLTVVAFGNADKLTKVRAFIDNGNGRDFVDLLPLGEGWIIKANPEVPSKNEGVTIQYNPENDVKDGQFKMVGEDAYVYTGARDYSGGFFQKADWGAVGQTEALKLTKNADGTSSWTIPSPIWQFYPGVEEAKILKELLFVFRNADGSKQGGDVIFPVGDGSGPTVTTDPKDASASKALAVTYYPWNDKKDGSFKMVGVPQVYVYTGGICEDGTYLEVSGWGNVGTNEGLKLTANADGTSTWNIADLVSLYKAPTDKKLKEILCVFRNAEGTRQGADVKIPIDQPTSVEDEKLAASVAVYPNPTPGMARITLPTAAVVTVSIANQLGEVLYRTTATGDIMWNGMDMSGNIVAPGAYFVHVQSATATAVMPLSIVR
ncbi:MAG: DUF4397 domain-containing protein [Ignavibacteria bacterium]|nr:DUF4397 domain-containing protein [Ignavibacteria bacterium]